MIGRAKALGMAQMGVDMVGIQGVNGVPEPKPERTGKVRGDGDSSASGSVAASASSPAKDGVSISAEAKAAADVARVVTLSSAQSDIRADKVAAARERIENGDFKNPEVVAQVAQRLMKFLI